MYVIHEIRDRLRRWLENSKLKNARARRYIMGGLFFALLTLILSTQVTQQSLDIQENDLAPMDLRAPRDIENKVATERKRVAASAGIPMQKKSDPGVLRQAEDYILTAFQDIRSVRDLPSQDERTKVDTLATRINVPTIPRETLAALLKMDDRLVTDARSDAINLIRASLAGMVGTQDVADLRARIDTEAPGYNILVTTDPLLKSFVKELVKSRVRANMIDDPEGTRKLKADAAAMEEPVIIKKGECCIIEANRKVTYEQIEMLKELGLVGSRANFRSRIGAALLALIVVSLMGLHLTRHRPDILEKDSKLLLLGLIGLATLLLSLLMRVFHTADGPNFTYLMPIAFNAMLVAILLDPKIALLQSMLLSIMAGMALEADQLNHILVMLVSSVVGIYSVRRVESRTDIYRAGLMVSGANIITILAAYMTRAEPLFNMNIWLDAGLGAANGLVTSVLVTGALPLFENLFGVVTPLKLLELSNPNHPLLKKLLVEAPGSYHHTILVANLCEAAAEAIGADQVLCRVGAYYHDIGKAKRPYFFVENQFGGENPHDKLPPHLSAMIITSHVKDGLEMALEARLPQEIVDFISEHHGTTLVSYFYHMASKNGQSEYVLEEDFRYEGPKPRSKETAICMLADGCEASVRAIRQKGHLTVEQIELQVKRIVEDRLAQGQLENCDLTLRDLDVIQKTFVKMLSGVHHARIDYPAEAQAPRLTAPQEAAVTAGPEEGDPVGDLDQQRAGEGSAERGPGDDRPEGGTEGA